MAEAEGGAAEGGADDTLPAEAPVAAMREVRSAWVVQVIVCKSKQAQSAAEVDVRDCTHCPWGVDQRQSSTAKMMTMRTDATHLLEDYTYMVPPPQDCRVNVLPTH